MRSFVNALLIVPVFVKMAYRVFVTNERTYKPFLFRVLKSLEKRFGAQIPDSYIKRFDLYTKIAAVFICWIETLRGEPLDRKQTEMAMLFCGLTPLFDDLLDEEHFSADELNLLTKKQIQRGTLIEKICIGFFEEMEPIDPDMSWTSRWESAMSSQFDSQRQNGQQLDSEEIKSLTAEKGGHALLLYFDAILQGNYSRDESDAIYQMGAIIQLTNDIFDVYKDSRAGISTLATRCCDMEELRNYYLSEVQKNMQQFRSLNYSRFRVRLFLLQYQLIVSRGVVALDQLLELQRNAGGDFDPSRFERRELICDMERWYNVRKSLLLTVKSV